MKVSTQQPFKIVYSLYEHQYLGYMFESFVVEVNDLGNLTLKHQNISSLNAHEFESGLDETDFKLIELMDDCQQEVIVKKFYNKPMLPTKFFEKEYEQKKNESLIAQIDAYLEKKRAEILSLLPGKNVFEMNNDGEPTGQPISVEKEKATVLFHFRRNADNTHYFPTIKFKGEKIEFRYKNSIIVCNEPAWLMVEGKLFTFEKEPDGKKLKPFLNKKFIAIPRAMEETYYRKFVVPLVESFNVYAKGFDIKSVYTEPKPRISITDVSGAQSSLFEEGGTEVMDQDQLVFNLSFAYNGFLFSGANISPTGVRLEKDESRDLFTFYRVARDVRFEKGVRNRLDQLGLPILKGRLIMEKTKAFSFISEHIRTLEKEGFEIEQRAESGKRYFLGQSFINVEISENKDWFDIHAVVKFGEYEMPFIKLRKLIIANKKEFKLPDGEIAVIPESWFTRYSELFNFSSEEAERPVLKKHHLAMVHQLKEGNLAKVTMSRKLENLRDFSTIEDQAVPKNFLGTLRPYQKAGYNWLKFLSGHKFGGCLADDMGLGKTVQTLALLQDEKNRGAKGANLLVMPTSLLYNWEMEAKKFTPQLKVFSYTGTGREKNIDLFNDYDLVLTSYGILRIDIDILKEYYFNYVILDESQVIKNPSSIIAQSVRKLNTVKRLILTGTPIENSTMDLWSQMHFINPGLLGTKHYFRKEFQLPIEKKNNPEVSIKLHTLIKPFVLRRHKSQVAQDLPQKVEKIQYCSMSPEQEEKYEKTKSYYRNKIMEEIEEKGVSRSQIMLLQGLTLLRQLANHPRMIEADSEMDSGKMENVLAMLETAIGDDHKILIFSQFVKHLQLLRESLDQQGIEYAYLDGSTKNRMEEVERFQKQDDLRLFLISLKAGGLGLNLTAADYVFILDPWWNPAVEQQAIDRAHRIGQENKVFTYKFITRNTVEEKILALQQSKLKLASDLITTEDSFVKSLTKEDINTLLS